MSRQKKKVTRQNAFGEIQRVFLTALKTQPEAMTDVIHVALEIPADCCMKVGAAIADLARQGLIERVGFTRTERSKAHGRHVSLWRLVK